MTARDFCYWLQGYFELADPHGGLTQEQADLIATHLALVFKHEIDPSAGDAARQAELNAIHDGQTGDTKTAEAAIKKAADAIAKADKQPHTGVPSRPTVYRC